MFSFFFSSKNREQQYPSPIELKKTVIQIVRHPMQQMPSEKRTRAKKTGKSPGYICATAKTLPSNDNRREKVMVIIIKDVLEHTGQWTADMVRGRTAS